MNPQSPIHEPRTVVKHPKDTCLTFTDDPTGSILSLPLQMGSVTLPHVLGHPAEAGHKSRSEQDGGLSLRSTGQRLSTCRLKVAVRI